MWKHVMTWDHVSTPLYGKDVISWSMSLTPLYGKYVISWPMSLTPLYMEKMLSHGPWAFHLSFVRCIDMTPYHHTDVSKWDHVIPRTTRLQNTGFSCMSADIQEKDLNEAKKTCILKGHRQNPSEPQNNFHCNLYINTQLYTLRWITSHCVLNPEIIIMGKKD
jgi:hypothetical protein